MILSSSDKRLILAAIKYGEPYKIMDLAADLSYYTKSKLVSELKDTDEKKYNYKLSERISNILIPESTSNLKRSISDLISTELSYSSLERDNNYKKINTLASNLVAFPTSKRLQKFLSKFVMSSKSLRDIVTDNNCDLKILKILQNICLESRKYANI